MATTPTSTTSSVPPLLTVQAGRLANIAYYSVGIQTEAGATPYSRVVNAGGASGLSVGVFQNDFKQHTGTAAPYAQAVFEWNANQGTTLGFTQEQFTTALKLGALNPSMQAAARGFGESTTGATWIHENFDVPHLQGAVQAAERAFATPYGQALLQEGTHVEEFAAFAMKVYNQYGPGREGAAGTVKSPGFGALMDYLQNGAIVLKDNRAGHVGETIQVVAGHPNEFNLVDLQEFSSKYALTRATFNSAVGDDPIKALKSGGLYNSIIDSDSPLSDVLLRQEVKGDFSPGKVFSDPDAAVARAVFGADTKKMMDAVDTINDATTLNPQQISAPLGQFPATVWIDPLSGRVAVRYSGEAGGGYIVSDDGYTPFETSTVIKEGGVRILKITQGGAQHAFDLAATPIHNSALPSNGGGITPASRVGPVVNTPYPGTGTATHHIDGSTTYENEVKADSADGRYKKGDLVSISYDKDPTNGVNFDSESIWRADGTVYQRSLSTDKTKETIVEWSKDNVKTRQITKNIATGSPEGGFIKDGQRYDASGSPILPADFVGPPPANVNPYTLLDAIPAPLPTKDSSALQVTANWGSENFGLADVDLSRLLQGTQVGYLPGAQIDTASKLEAEMIAQGYEVSRDENGIYASKGEQYFSFTSEAMIFQNGSQWAVVALTPNGEVISGSHLGVNVREMHVDIGGADTVLLGHLSGDGDDLGDEGSDAFVIDQVISINGQTSVNGALLNAALADENFDLADLWVNGSASGQLVQLITTGDASDSDGFTPAEGASSQPGQETAWYETAEAKRFGSTLAEVQSLIAALKGGGPLPIAVGVFNLAARASRSAELGTLAGGINTLASLQGLTNALERGDEIGALASGATFVKNAYAQFFKDSVTQGIEALGGIDTARALAELGDEAAADLVQTFEVFENLDTALPYLNLINAISKGDEVGIATSSLFILEALGYSWAGPVGWAIVGIQLLSSLFDDDVEISGDAVFSANGDGKRVQAVLTAQGADGGGSTVMSVMDNLLAGLQTVINTQLPEGDWGLIASRLPWLHFTGYEGGGGIFSMSWSDGQSGAVHTRQFNVDGDYLGSSDVAEIANSEDFHKSMGQQFIEIATGKFQGDAALVQGWESQTAYAQATRGYDEPVYETQWMESDSGGSYQQVQVGTRHVGGINDPLAGYNTEQRARAQGLWLGSNPGDATPGNAGGINSNNSQTSSQTAHPIVLDLDNNGITITTKAQGGSVLVDVDNDGFAEETDWINPRDGILVIDRNGDGQISGGAEMFSDAQVNMAARGLNVLQALDADGDNKITGSDFAFNQLRVWQDINHDGVAQSYELASLSAKGITELNIGNGQQGQFVMGGVGRGMQATALSADSAGFITQNLGNSLLLIRETGEASLLASALADYGQSTDAAVRAAHSHASADGVLSVVDELMDGLEDTAIKVSAAANMERWRLVA